MQTETTPMPIEGCESAAEKPDKRRRAGGAIIGCALACALAVGGALQFLTDHKTVTNDLALDTDLSIELTEPNWDPEAAKQMVPEKEVAKDPTIANDGTVSEYVFAKVKVPVFTGKVAGEDGKATDVVDADLFAFDANEGWTQIGTATVEGGFRTYTFAYDDPLAAGESAAPVFSKVKTANLTTGLEITDTQIVVDAYAIQSLGFDTAGAAWAAYSAQEVAAASDSDNG